MGVALGEAAEQSAPVVASPILGLHLGADADGEDGAVAGGGENLMGAVDLGGGEVEIPAAGVVEAGVAEGSEGAGEAGGLGLEVIGIEVARGRRGSAGGRG